MTAKVLQFTALLAVLAAAVSAAAVRSGCGGKCSTSRPCEYGFMCIGGTCKKTEVPANGPCPSACDVCAPGLQCGKTKVCESPIKPVKCGERCVGGKTCETGSKRVGDKCIHEVTTAGGSCARVGCDVCTTGLKCLNGVCTKSLSKCAGQCRAVTDCEAGLICMFGNCRRETILGGSCAISGCGLCVGGLDCVNNVCIQPLGGCESQCAVNADCEPGLTCYKGKCMVFSEEGFTCNNGCNVCKPGLFCTTGVLGFPSCSRNP
jgi:hypothetical protein